MIDLSELLESRTDAPPPFFIVGSVRSGTTLLRDLLRAHPNLECPEETHFFRHADPFGSPPFLKAFSNRRIFRYHRELDGISEDEFSELLNQATSRKELALGYAALYLHKRGNPSARWFDKTPQHVYNLPLLAAEFPHAKFIHLYRNPLNVVASLHAGEVMAVHDTTGAINYWREAMKMIWSFKKAHGDRLLEIAYEDLVQDPAAILDRIMAFVDVDPAEMEARLDSVRPERNRYQELLDGPDIKRIKRECNPFFRRYGYG